MEMKKRVLTGALCGALLVGTVVPALAATEHYNNGASVGGSAEWTAWTQDWESVATDYTKVSLTPGADETELNFAWYSKDDGKAATPVVHFGTDRNNLKTFTGKAADVDASLTDGVAYDYNHVTVTGLQENTTYYYTVEKNGVQTEPVEYTTGSFSSIKMLYVGDPQVGASGSAGQGTTDDANIAVDTYNWDKTLRYARANEGKNASFMLVASMNPCPCGYYNHPTKACVCSPGQVQKYLNRISGPLLDRIDLQIEVVPVPFEKMSDAHPGEASSIIRERVIHARQIQENRYAEVAGVYCNAQMNSKLLSLYARPDDKGLILLKNAMNRLNLSARAYDRILKVARTIADLENSDLIQTSHLAEAIGYRNLDREDWAG